MELKMRRDAMRIFRAALVAADPKAAVLRELGRRKLARYRHVYVIGAGKASAAMAQAVEKSLGARVTGGWINTKHGHLAKLRRIHLHECSHPVPDEAGVHGARQILAMAEQAGEEDLVICLISGGASALLPLPASPLTLEEKQQTTKLLLACGANIHEMNAVRKHLSAIKGGQLARAAAPATVLSLILSDVVGDPLDVIGSGPTAADSTTFHDASEIIDRYGLWDRLPPAVVERLRSSDQETPKPGDEVLARVTNIIVGSNRLAVNAASQAAKGLGYRPLVLSTTIEGETREIAKMHAEIAREIGSSGQPLKPPACVISGGETTVTLTGDGLGGRNQEFVLAAVPRIAGLPGVVVFSAGTDGTDGPTDAAGAVADGRTFSRNPHAGTYLTASNSYAYFQSLGDLVKTGPTGTNVMDIRLLLVAAEKPKSR